MMPVRVERRRFPVRLNDLVAGADMLNDFDRMTNYLLGTRSDSGVYMPTNVWEDSENLYIEIELPGLKSEDVNLSFEDGQLTIEAEKKASEDQRQYHLAERRFGKSVRTFSLPNVVDPNSINAGFTNGILTVTLAKRPETKARRIEIKPE